MGSEMCIRDSDRGIGNEVCFLEYLKRNNYSDEFCFDFLFPTLSSTVCTCSYAALADYPAVILLDALSRMTQDQPLLKTRFGTQDVVRRLTDGVSDIRVKTQVHSMIEQESRVELKFETGERCETEAFDHVIVSTQANQAARMLPELSAEETRFLDSFVYENIRVTVHTDEALMPEQRKHWSTFNMISRQAAESSSDVDNSLVSQHDAMCTVWMNRFHADWPETSRSIFQTINPIVAPNPSAVIGTAVLQRPVVRSESFQSWDLLDELHAQPGRRIWFSGSYATAGIPLLETAMLGSMSVVQRLKEMVASGHSG